MLTITNFTVCYQQQIIVKNIDLKLSPGEIVLLMGPNGSGKSTLTKALMGHPYYSVETGLINLDGKDITNSKPEERVKQGLFLAWQNPMTVPGVSLTKLSRELGLFKNGVSQQLKSFRLMAEKLRFSDSLLLRGLNDGFSGGERKKIEMLQALIFGKKYYLFDEIDTGLDIDALKVIAQEINRLKKNQSGCLVVTHYPGLVKLLDLDRVLVMKEGKIIKTGQRSLAEKIENEGYERI